MKPSRIANGANRSIKLFTEEAFITSDIIEIETQKREIEIVITKPQKNNTTETAGSSRKIKFLRLSQTKY